MVKIFNSLSWSKLEKTLEQKSNIFLSQFALIAASGAFFSLIHDAIFEALPTVLIDFGIIVIFVVCYWVNEQGKHLAAKLIFTLASPSIIFFYATVIPQSNGVFFYFFPIITITFLLFDREDNLYKYGAIIYTIILLFVLEYTSYEPFGPPIYASFSSATSYQLNLLISILVTIFSLVSFDKLNKIIEEKRDDALAMVKSKNLELNHINEELDKFVYSASHDLKAPLLSILGIVNLAKYEIKDELSLDYFEKIESRINKLNTFIKEVIEISRNSRTELLNEYFKLRDLTKLILDYHNYSDSDSSIEIICKVDKDLEIFTDRSRLEMVLNNIISNALKYRNPDIEKHTVSICSHIKNNQLKIVIADNGIGIEEIHMDKIFDMFYRGHEASEGSGLGLYIVKSTLEKLNASIQINSVFNRGTEVTLSLPEGSLQK